MNHPATTHALFGHAATILGQLQDEHRAGQLAHGILLSGQQGIGKATLAYQFALNVLGGGEGTMARILAGSHSDLLVIEPLYNEKKDEMAREITAEQTRKISEFLSMTSGEGGWRVVIIDGAEAMNHFAANAILKILEEPPPRCVLILISHHAGRLLPTIRSRCRYLRVSPLSTQDFTAIMRRALPDETEGLYKKLGEIADYSPGLALSLHAQGALEMLEELELVFSELPDLSHERVFALAESIASGKQHQNWQVFTRLMLHLCAQSARSGHSLFWAEKWREAAEQLSLTEARHLDYKSAVISFLHSLSTRSVAA